MSVLQTLKERLKSDKPIPFVEFMQLALYDPEAGYYTGGLHKIGKQGDFTTSPELTPLFGYTIANQCQQVLGQLESGSILEYGAGTGRLCVDVLLQLEALNTLPEHYYILELSANLRHRQQELINQTIPHLASKVQWLSQWPQNPFKGVILANEVLDAMPVHRFMYTEQGVLESYIGLTPDDQLKEQFQPSEDSRLLRYIEDNLQLSAPYLSEVNLFIDDWLRNNFQILQQGAVFLIDYGFPRHEYYHPDRHQGTLMCHYQHHAHTDPLVHPGEQDITAHVDFTHVAEAGYAAGFHVAGYTNQASFLLSNGLLSLVNELTTEKEQFQAKQAIKQLIQPNEMGELFKVIAFTKSLDIDLNGFQLMDKRASL